MKTPTHILKETKREGSSTKVVTNCGATYQSKSHAEAFEHCTAWASLATCDGCLATQHPPRAFDLLSA